MSETERIVEILGGKKTLGTSPKGALDIVDVVRRGLPYKVVEEVASIQLDMSGAELLKQLQLKERTIIRRKQQHHLNAAESERVLRLARVLARATEILGRSDGARHLIFEPNGGLGGRTPMSLLDTDVGVDTVLNVLAQIEHGFAA